MSSGLYIVELAGTAAAVLGLTLVPACTDDAEQASKLRAVSRAACHTYGAPPASTCWGLWSLDFELQTRGQQEPVDRGNRGAVGVGQVPR